MRQLFPRRMILGVGVLLVGGLCAPYLAAQPPGPGKGKEPKGPPRPAPDAQFMTVRGTVKELTTAPKGEVDGLRLSDGKWVHWPPHLQDRFKDIAGKGDQVRATGYWETGPAGDPKLEVSALTNLNTDKSAENPDRPPPARFGQGGTADARGREAQTVRGKVERFTTAPKGETDGAVLEDGTTLHWPPHMQDRFTDVVKKGDRVRAKGRTETGPAGDTHFEIQSVTNLRSDATAQNPDFATAPPPGGPRRVARDKAGDVEQHLRALEDRIDQLQKEIERLRRKK